MPIRNSEVDAEFDIVIVGAGPAGLSAASRAAARGNRYLLLEAEDHAADTIFQYQKGKHVMAEPDYLPLRSGLSFAAGKREQILATWDEELGAQSIAIRYRHKVRAISREAAHQPFVVACDNGETFTSRAVILSIGLQGNPRTLGVPGEKHPRISATLRDPDEYHKEVIIVVGAGDAGIENAVALSRHNEVHLMNRSEEFTRCKDGNRILIQNAERARKVRVWHTSSPLRVEETGGDPPLNYVFRTAEGEQALACHRVIARLGATPPRKLVEGFGVNFTSADQDAVPALSDTYESSVPGLFIVGALAGCPLVKQAMNQGQDVVDTLNGDTVEPADEDLIRARLAHWWSARGDATREREVSSAMEEFQAISPLLAAFTRLQLRELLLESELHAPAEDEVIFRLGDYTNTFYTVLRGTVRIRDFALGSGRFFGEMGLISGRRRTATVTAGKDCLLLETSRRTMLRMMATSPAVAHLVDEAFLRNAARMFLANPERIGADAAQRVAAAITEQTLDRLLAGGVPVRQFAPGEWIFREGDVADGLYLIRRGAVAVVKGEDHLESILNHMGAGNYFGEMALLTDDRRSASVRATVFTETLCLPGDRLKAELVLNPQLRESLQHVVVARTRADAARDDHVPNDPHSEVVRYFMHHGVGEASNLLLIDEMLCVHCDNCDTACAETHGGISRLRRESGPSSAYLHVAESCRHCEQPYCMKDCPPNAISRAADGEVYISDACIGCGNCETNCPYGAVRMAPVKPPRWGGGWLWLLFGLGKAPGQRAPDYDPEARKVAVKCDLCRGLDGGPRCVSACPTGAAHRISGKTLFESLGKA